MSETISKLQLKGHKMYNGWTNKETWLVNLWLGDTFAVMQEKGEAVTTGVIESYVQECIGDIDGKSVESGFLIDLLNCALGEINYRELAEHYAPTEDEDDE
jgi:hypothetical protein